MPSTFLHLSKDSFKFSAGHMTVFPDGTKERLHGHNFQVAVTVELPADGFIAFARFKQEITAACEAWDERVMLPRLSPYLQLRPSPQSAVDFILCGDHYVLPRRDVLWFDVESVTTERLATELCRIIAVGMLPLWREGRILSLAVQISETAGQGASFHMSAADVLSLAPRVSIVLSCYNKAATVAESAKSVLGQTYGNLELVVIDDGSSDHSAQVLEGLKSDRRVRVETTPNAGQAAALNLGLSLARGEYVGFIDADDAYHPEHVETLVEACESSDLDVAFAGIDVVQCGSQTHVVDFFDRTRLIPISEVDCVTGIIFGRRSVLAGLGFVGGGDQRDGEAAVLLEPSCDRGDGRYEDRTRRGADDAVNELELEQALRAAGEPQAQPQQRTAAQHDVARSDVVGQRAPAEGGDAHRQEDDRHGARDADARPAGRIRHRQQEDGQGEDAADRHASHRSACGGDDPTVVYSHRFSRRLGQTLADVGSVMAIALGRRSAGVSRCTRH